MQTANVSPAAYRKCFVFCFAVATCFGCGDRESFEHAPTKPDSVSLAILAHSPSKDIDRVLQKVDKVLAAVYAEKLPDRFPNWIAFHAVLMYGDSAYAEYREKKTTSENLDRIFSIILNSTTSQNGPYVMRGKSPYPRHKNTIPTNFSTISV
jgi:hypothetical protein